MNTNKQRRKYKNQSHKFAKTKQTPRLSSDLYQMHYPRPRFTTTDAGLINIVKMLHNDLFMTSLHYYTISESMLLYYATILLWVRKIQCTEYVDCTNKEEVRNFKHEMESFGNYKLPKLLATYYKGIGNTSDPAGNKYQWSNVIWPNSEMHKGVSGYFGPVNNETHIHYMNQISPGVVAQRILEDLAYQSNANEDRTWNLPETLRPTNENAGLPTSNLLGYDLKTHLTREQIGLLHKCGITTENGNRSFGVSNHVLCWNANLCYEISNVLDREIQCVPMEIENLIGSQSQIPYYVASDDENLVMELKSSFNFSSKISDASMAFMYRTEKKTLVDNRALWAIYEFENFTAVPTEWINRSNYYFTYGQVDMWNHGFRSTIGNQSRLLRALQNKINNSHAVNQTSANLVQCTNLTFTTTDAGLQRIVKMLHQDFCIRLRGYATQMTESMLLYYATILLWIRKAEIVRHDFLKQHPNEIKNLTSYVRNCKVPKLLGMYYSSIGNISDPAGNQYTWNNVIWPNPEMYDGVSGYFGPVTDETHIHYMNQLSPGIVAQRILEEIACHNNNSLCPVWNLPQSLRPRNQNAGLPTPNLLGYEKIENQLTDRQLQFLDEAGVNIKNGERSFGHISNHTFCLNQRLFSIIQSLVDTVMTVRNVQNENFSIEPHGSHNQIPYVVDTQISSYGSKELKLESAFDFNSNISNESLAFMYRVKKENSNNGIEKWAIYSFENYTQVPSIWSQNFNYYFTYGKQEMWNYGYRETTDSQLLLLRSFMEAMVKEASFDSDSSDD